MCGFLKDVTIFVNNNNVRKQCGIASAESRKTTNHTESHTEHKFGDCENSELCNNATHAEANAEANNAFTRVRKQE
jgi:hypothetical protein